MTYLLWRLHHVQVLVVATALVVFTVVLLLIPSKDNLAISILAYATIGVPLILGVFCGAPLLAAQFEGGTHSLDWTQGIARRRWLSGNLAGALAAATVCGAAISAVVTWWSLAHTSLHLSRISNGPFDIQGIVPLAYAIFAVALGIAVGSMCRRVLPAMAITGAIFIAVRAVITGALRPHYMSPVHMLVPSDQGTRGQDILSILPQGSRTLITYQPSTRFWAFQGIETGIYLVLAAALVALAYRMVLKRDA
jgi:hypothetical protein